MGNYFTGSVNPSVFTSWRFIFLSLLLSCLYLFSCGGEGGEIQTPEIVLDEMFGDSSIGVGDTESASFLEGEKPSFFEITIDPVYYGNIKETTTLEDPSKLFAVIEYEIGDGLYQECSTKVCDFYVFRRHSAAEEWIQIENWEPSQEKERVIFNIPSGGYHCSDPNYAPCDITIKTYWYRISIQIDNSLLIIHSNYVPGKAPADINRDGWVNPFDVTLFLRYCYGSREDDPNPGFPSYSEICDFVPYERDGVVNLSDLVNFSAWYRALPELPCIDAGTCPELPP